MTKPIYHFSCKIINRKKNKSIVARAAYISGQKLYDNESKRNWNYTGKNEVKFTTILLPENAPERLKNPETLWNEIDKLEFRANAQLARSFDIALPNEWSQEQCQKVMVDFCKKNFVDDGMLVQAALHLKEGNYHFHVLTPMRGFKPDGSWEGKTTSVFITDENGEKIPALDQNGEQKIRNGKKVWLRKNVSLHDWDDKETLKRWRTEWANEVNRYLPKEQWISEKSLLEQGITDRLPTVHEGLAGHNIQSRGERSWKVERNQRIIKLNQMRQQMIEQSALLQQRELEFERLKTEIEEEERKEKQKQKQQEQQKTETGAHDYSRIIDQKIVIDEGKKQSDTTEFTPEQRERYDKYFAEMAREYVELQSIFEVGMGAPNPHNFVSPDDCLSYENLKKAANTLMDREFDFNEIEDKGLIGIYQKNKIQIDGYFSYLPADKQNRSDAAKAVTALKKGLRMYVKQLDDQHEIVTSIGNELYRKNRKSCLDKKQWEQKLKEREEHEKRHQEYEKAHAAYEFRQALRQLDYNLSVHMSAEKRQALRDYQETQWKIQQEQRRMQRGFDFD